MTLSLYSMIVSLKHNLIVDVLVMKMGKAWAWVPWDGNNKRGIYNMFNDAIDIPMDGRYSPRACNDINVEGNVISVQIIRDVCNTLFLSALVAYVNMCVCVCVH